MRSIEFDHLFRESFLLLEDLIKFTAINEWHDEVKTCIRLEHVFHAAEELVIGFEQNVLLERRRLDLIVLYQHVLSDSLDSVFFTCLGKNGQIYSSERSLTKLQLNVKIFEIHIR